MNFAPPFSMMTILKSAMWRCQPVHFSGASLARANLAMIRPPVAAAISRSRYSKKERNLSLTQGVSPGFTWVNVFTIGVWRMCEAPLIWGRGVVLDSRHGRLRSWPALRIFLPGRDRRLAATVPHAFQRDMARPARAIVFDGVRCAGVRCAGVRPWRAAAGGVLRRRHRSGRRR